MRESRNRIESIAGCLSCFVVPLLPAAVNLTDVKVFPPFTPCPSRVSYSVHLVTVLFCVMLIHYLSCYRLILCYADIFLIVLISCFVLCRYIFNRVNVFFSVTLIYF